MSTFYEQWRASLRPKQKKRTYQHFDRSHDLADEQVFKLVERAIENLDRHQFLPFVKFFKKEIRYRRDANGQRIRSPKLRPIMYASHLDAHIYGFFSYRWSEIYEKFLVSNGISENVIAYRKIPDGKRNKSNIHFAREVFQYIQKNGDSVAIVADISHFFDSLKHNVLKQQLCRILGTDELGVDEYKVFRSLTAFRFVMKDDRKESEYSRVISQIKRDIQKGKSLPQAVYERGRNIILKNQKTVAIPQGSPVSGLLANIYLSAFDSSISASFPNTLYRRYSDDIVLVCTADDATTAIATLKKEIKITH